MAHVADQNLPTLTTPRGQKIPNPFMPIEKPTPKTLHSICLSSSIPMLVVKLRSNLPNGLI